MTLLSARLYPFCLAVLLGGCALFPSPAPVARPAQPEFASFALNGRISIIHQEKRHSAGLRWTHQAQTDEILLLGPLGQTAARVHSDTRRGAQQATLDDGSKHYQADDAESLMEQVLGWHLPLNGLHHWALGMADPGRPARIEHNGNGQVAVLHQDGWEVRYLKYADTGREAMPARLELLHEDMRVILLIDEWEWDPQ